MISIDDSDEDPGADGGDEFDNDDASDSEDSWECSECWTMNHPMTTKCYKCWKERSFALQQFTRYNIHLCIQYILIFLESK